MYLSDKWEDYRIIDASGGEKLEYWGKYLLRRPDPIAVWDDKTDINQWNKVDAWYHRSNKGGGSWQVFNKSIPDKWQIKYRDLVFNVRPTGFKHTGLFPEQAVNWDFISDLIKSAKRDQIVDFQLCASVLDMTVALLGFVDQRADRLLRQIAVLTKISHSDSIVHAQTPYENM